MNKKQLISILVLIGMVLILSKQVYFGAGIGLVIPIFIILFGDSIVSIIKRDWRFLMSFKDYVNSDSIIWDILFILSGIGLGIFIMKKNILLIIVSIALILILLVNRVMQLNLHIEDDDNSS